MLKLNRVSKVYRTGLVETHALRDFSLHVKKGEFVAVTGPSGSGKTTFLTIAGLLDEPTSGEFLLDGTDVRGLSDARRSRLRNEMIGFVFQSFNLLPELTIAANIEVPLRYRHMPASERRRRVSAALATTRLTAHAGHYPSELSNGLQQRAAIARALAGSPQLLLADEPTGNLDSRMAREVMLLLEELHQGGATVVMVTHDSALAARAQREVHILDGAVVDLFEPQRPAVTGGVAHTPAS